MKLVIGLERRGHSAPRLVIRDDRGQPLPMVREVEVRHVFGEAPEVVIRLVADGRAVSLATPVVETEE